MQVLLFLCQHK